MDPDLPTPTEQPRQRAIDVGKVVVSSLDVLVRSVRAEGQNLITISRRATELWRDNPEVALSFRPTAVMVGERVRLKAKEQEGRWILPTFMSGLRELQPSPRLTVEDMVQLAQELAALETSAESITRFQDWLWSDGAEGFRIELAPSFVEMLDSVTVADERRRPQEGIAAVREDGAAVVSLDSIDIATSDLDEVALRPEFQVPLDLYAERVRGDRDRLSEGDRKAMRERADDVAGWIAAEVTVTLARPRMRSAIPAARLARRIVSLLAGGADLGLLKLLADLCRQQEDDPYLETVFTQLERQDLGRTLAETLRFDDAALLPSIERFVSVAPPTVATDLVHGLLDRAREEAAAFSGMVGLLQSGEAATVRRSIHLPTLGEPGALTLLKAMQAIRAPSSQLLAVLDEVSDKTAIAVLAELPGEVFEQHAPLLERLLASDDARALDAVTDMLLEARSPLALRMLAEAFKRRRGEGWRRVTLRRICSRLVAAGLGGEFLIDLVRSRSAPAHVRRIALASLDQQPRLRAAASAWRLQELLDPPEVRQQLRQARRADKEAM